MNDPLSAPETPELLTHSSRRTAMSEEMPGASVLEEFLDVVSRLNSSITDLPIFSDYSIGPANWALLKALKDGPLSTDQLAQHASLSRQRVRVQVKELEAKQFLIVARQDEGDRRARIVQLSPHGSRALEEISTWLDELGQKISNKKFLAGIKQMRLLQRLFLQEKRVRHRETRMRSSQVGKTSALPAEI